MKPVKKYLVFETGEELYGIELKYVLKIKNNAIKESITCLDIINFYASFET